VPVTVEVRHGDPAEALLAASRVADLLVVGRHAGSAAPLAVSLAGAADCPVMVVPVPRQLVPSQRRGGRAAALR
jgi:nucleotide-binding universal stress UspA family protein